MNISDRMKSSLGENKQEATTKMTNKAADNPCMVHRREQFEKQLINEMFSQY